MWKIIQTINLYAFVPRYDFLNVFDGSSSQDTKLASLTGVLPPNITSSGSEILIQFVSDDTEVYAGFKIQFNAGMRFKKIEKWQNSYDILSLYCL